MYELSVCQPSLPRKDLKRCSSAPMTVPSGFWLLIATAFCSGSGARSSRSPKRLANATCASSDKFCAGNTRTAYSWKACSTVVQVSASIRARSRSVTTAPSVASIGAIFGSMGSPRDLAACCRGTIESRSRRAGPARQEGGQEPEQQEKGAHAVDGGDAGEVSELAEGGGAQTAQAEREAVKHPRRQTYPARQQLLRIDQDGREGRGHDHGDEHGQNAGPEQVGVRQEQGEGQGPQDREPHDGNTSHAVTDRSACKSAGHDAGEEREQIELRRLDGQVELVDQIEGVVRAQAGAVDILGEEQGHEDGHRLDDLPAWQRVLA